MITLAMRTDKPEAELYVYQDESQIAQLIWSAHRELGVSLHRQIQRILEGQKISLQDIGRIVVYEGPGSFTGLRIGVSVANALAYTLNIPVVGASGESWLQSAVVEATNNTQKYVSPLYGADPHITQPKK